jgi:hypothetical protein
MVQNPDCMVNKFAPECHLIKLTRKGVFINRENTFSESASVFAFTD